MRPYATLAAAMAAFWAAYYWVVQTIKGFWE